MNGLKKIMDGIKELMNELFQGVEENGNAYRSMAEHLGVTGVGAIVEAVLTGGINKEMPYPVLHFHVTLARNVPEAAEQNIYRSLNELNNVISVGEYPSFGNFAYYPRLRQIYLSYRLPLNAETPEAELINIKYYLEVLYEQLDLFADFIIFLCDNDGRMVPMEEYIDYLSQLSDINDIEERIDLLLEKLKIAGFGAESPESGSEEAGRL
ncbi:MAG: hypothetical protein K5770_02575 [Lachnospiraceae bacterium]|nr:hypothetical protein [Lachnospiraceae bacterium]